MQKNVQLLVKAKMQNLSKKLVNGLTVRLLKHLYYQESKLPAIGDSVCRKLNRGEGKAIRDVGLIRTITGTIEATSA